MNFRKKVGASAAALLMAGVFGFAGTTSAYADVTPTSTSTITATLNTSETGQVKGEAYKVINANWAANGQPSTPQYDWANQSLADWLRSYENPAGTKPFASYVASTGTAVTDAFGQITDGSSQARSFYEELTAAIKSGDITGVAAQPLTIADKNASLANATMGGYLLTFEGGVEVYEPTLALVYPSFNEDSGEWTLSEQTGYEIKSSLTPFNKSASTVSVGINELVTFTLDGIVVPTYPLGSSNTTFAVFDSFPDQLSFAADANVTVKTGLGADLATYTDLPADAYTLTTRSANSAPQDLSTPAKDVDLSIIFDYTKLVAGNNIVITYDTVVNEEARADENGFVNEAKLTYSNDPYTAGKYNELPGQKKLYTYGLHVQKTDGTNPLAGAEFTLSSTGADAAVMKFVPVGEGVGGSYRVATTAEAAGETATTVLATDETGALYIDGLDADSYSLQETKAPDGYVLLADPINVQIKDDDANGLVDENPYADNPALVTLTVENSKGFTLPKTGAAGVAAMVGGGVILVGGGALVLRATRRKSA